MKLLMLCWETLQYTEYCVSFKSLLDKLSLCIHALISIDDLKWETERPPLRVNSYF